MDSMNRSMAREWLQVRSFFKFAAPAPAAGKSGRRIDAAGDVANALQPLERED